MSTKNTRELENILKGTHLRGIPQYLSEQSESIIRSDRPFSDYIRERIKEKGLKQQDVFLDADIPERYGYKLITGEKHTRQRDIILRLCYAAHLTLEETQKALKLYEMPGLYAKIPRDALIMVAFNERPGSIIEVNSFLTENGMEVLRPSGVQE